jgi:twinkle protein
MALNLIPDNINFNAYLDPIPEKANIKSAADYGKAVMDRMYAANGEKSLPLPWDPDCQRIGLRKGKVSLWTGITHHGKSSALQQAMIYLVSKGEKVCIWSGEEEVDEVLERLVSQATAERKPARNVTEQFLNWAGEGLWFYDQFGIVKSERLVAVMNYAVRELGITQFVIDSLMKTSIKGDDYNDQKDFANLLAASAKASGCHVHLVAHLRKTKDESLPTIMDIKGAGDIFNQTDNVFLMWKNKARIEEAQKQFQNQDIMKEPENIFESMKHRGGTRWTGKIALRQDKNCQQFTLRQASPERYFTPKLRAAGESPL